jgi:HPt (histidine-containing phosphotransfer) domain-containing protein
MTDLPPHRPPGSPEPAGAHPGEPGLDESALAQLRSLDPDGRHGVLQRVLTAFENSLLKMQAQLSELGARGNAKAIGDIAHTIKSSSASVGALALSRLCADAERAARAGELERLERDVVALQIESTRVLRLVRAMLRD